MPSIVSPFKARRCLLIKSLVTRRARSVCKNVQQILLLLLVQRRTFYHRSFSIATMAPSSSAEIIFATSLLSITTVLVARVPVLKIAI